MKVEKLVVAPPPFAPIVITVETEEEAEYMWYVLNTSITELEERTAQYGYKVPRGIGFGSDLNIQIWRRFDDVFKPVLTE